MKFASRQFARGLEEAISGLPRGFFDTFEYTSRGNNLSHPITVGAIATTLARLYPNQYVGVDVRFNDRSGSKFQPDLVVFDDELRPVLLVDYESPNSSDARVPEKDWRAHGEWAERSGCAASYVVITTLPNENAPKWELRWVSGGQCNAKFKGRRAEVRENPFEFWYRHYRSQSKLMDGKVKMLNIDRGRVRVIDTRER